MITVEEAEKIISGELQVLPIENLPFHQAIDRVLRETISADRDLPPYERVMMDGIAIASEAWFAGTRKFEVAGVQLPGRPPLALQNSQQCIKTMTGAVLPTGCNLIIPCEEFDEKAEWIQVNTKFDAKPSRYLHKRGADCAKGDVLLKEGTQLGPREIAVAVSCGKEILSVTRKIKLHVIDTGDELIEVGEPIEDYQIRRSNAHSLIASCTRIPFVVASSHHCPDDEQILRRTIAATIGSFDVLLLCGGVSKGDRDLIPSILGQLGFKQRFHWVSQWPGKPMWFGNHPGGTLAFGLPGNPLSALTCFHRYVQNALLMIAGAQPMLDTKASLTEAITHNPPTTAFFPVSTSSGPNAILEATPRRPGNSGDFAAIVKTDGFVQLPAEQKVFPAGFNANFFAW